MKSILSKLKRVWFLVLVFLPQLALAGNGILPGKGVSTFTPTPGDWSVTFLRQIFGQVGNGSVLAGAPQTIIGKLFGVFNSAMLVLISVVIIYIIIKTVIDIASFGEVIGRKISHWTAVRTTFGIGLLVPTASGYSYIQIIIMWAVIQGIGLADQAWTTAVKYLKHGGVIYTTPAETAKVDRLKLPLVDAVPDDNYNTHADDSKIGSSDVLASLSCMHVIEHAIDNKKAVQKQYYLNHPENAPKDPAEYRALMNKLDNKNTLQPGYTKDHRVVFPQISQDDPNSDFNGVCGVYNWNVSDFNVSGKNASPIVSPSDIKRLKTNYLQAKEAGIRQMVLTLDPLAKNLVNQDYQSVNNNIDNVTNNDANSAAYVVNGANDYQTIIYPVALYAAALEEKGSSTMDKGMINAGWAAAGRYYAQLSENVVLPGLDSNYNKGNYRVSVDSIYPPAIDSGDFNNSKRKTALQGVEKELDSYSNTTVDKEVLEKALTQIDKIRISAVAAAYQRNTDIRNSDNKTKMPDLSNSTFFKHKKNFRSPFAPDIGYLILRTQVHNVVDTWFNYMVPHQKGDNTTEYNTPPIYKLEMIGNAMMTGAKKTWVQIFEWNIALRAHLAAGFLTSSIINVGGALASTSAFGFFSAAFNAVGTTIGIAANLAMGLVNSILFMTLPLVIAVTGPMFLTGVILSTYVPLIPFMLFTFGIISWLIFVIEAMAAAPLVALGITHPEGHDLMGKAEQALMLWLSVFLRPIAMIIGLIGGMVLIHVAMTVLNAGFGGVVDSLFLKDVDKVSSFKSIILMLIYTFIVVALVNQCFGLIHIIPEKIMRWIGLSPEHSDAPQLMESVKGGVTPFAEATASGAGRTAAESPRAIDGSRIQASEDRALKGIKQTNKAKGTISPNQ
jgi:conjugal transfer/type IV secretion protein DotA/TraY